MRIFWLSFFLLVASALGDTGDVVSFHKIADTTGTTLSDGDFFGWAMANVGDVDGDGVVDLVVSSPGDDTGGNSRGAIRLITLNADGSVKALRKYAHGEGPLSLSDFDSFGDSLDSLGDFDSNGVTDLVVGAPLDNTGGPFRGALYVLLFDEDGDIETLRKIAHGSGSDATLTLPDRGNFAVSVAALPDIDGDGVGDLAVGARKEDSFRGAVYILFLNADGSLRDFQRIASGAGGVPSGILDDDDLFGDSLESPGDVNGDGIPDLLVGASGDDQGGMDRGAVYLLHLKADGTVLSQRKFADGLGGIPAGSIRNADSLGRSITMIGDINRDGISDMIVGAVNYDSHGACYLLPLTPSFTVKSIHRTDPVREGLTGGDPLDFGTAVAPIGDFNGDGILDVAVGDPSDPTAGGGPGELRGAVYLLNLSGSLLPDSRLGKKRNPNRHKGNDIYNASGRGQKGTLKIRGRRKAKYHFSSQNDNNGPDTLRARANRLSRKFRFRVFRLTGGRKNVTAAFKRGVPLRNLGSGAIVLFRLQATNKQAGRPAQTRLKFVTEGNSRRAPGDTAKLKIKARR